MVIGRGGGNAADVWNRHVHGILSSLGTVDFDGASLIGTACPHAAPQTIPNDRGQSPFPRKGVTSACVFSRIRWVRTARLIRHDRWPGQRPAQASRSLTACGPRKP